jgi:hypothetical protein
MGLFSFVIGYPVGMKDDDTHYFVRKYSLPRAFRQLAGPRSTQYRTDALCGKYARAPKGVEAIKTTTDPDDVTCDRCRQLQDS